jgi:hypothetical protein
MKKMTMAAAIAVVLVMTAFGPTLAVAAPQQSFYSKAVTKQSSPLLDAILRFLGLAPSMTPQQAHPQNGNSSQIQTPPPQGGGASYSPEEAIWGGSGRCRTGC